MCEALEKAAQQTPARPRSCGRLRECLQASRVARWATSFAIFLHVPLQPEQWPSAARAQILNSRTCVDSFGPGYANSNRAFHVIVGNDEWLDAPCAIFTDPTNYNSPPGRGRITSIPGYSFEKLTPDAWRARPGSSELYWHPETALLGPGLATGFRLGTRRRPSVVRERKLA